MSQLNQKSMTKKKLKEIYSRPEKYPFERLNALMDWAIKKLNSPHSTVRSK